MCITFLVCREEFMSFQRVWIILQHDRTDRLIAHLLVNIARLHHRYNGPGGGWLLATPTSKCRQLHKTSFADRKGCQIILESSGWTSSRFDSLFTDTAFFIRWFKIGSLLNRRRDPNIPHINNEIKLCVIQLTQRNFPNFLTFCNYFVYRRWEWILYYVSLMERFPVVCLTFLR